MPLYTFYLRNPAGFSPSLETHELPSDGEAFEQAGALLDQHYGADHVEIWDHDRPVVSRYREQPVIRPVRTPEPVAAVISAAVQA